MENNRDELQADHDRKEELVLDEKEGNTENIFEMKKVYEVTEVHEVLIDPEMTEDHLEPEEEIVKDSVREVKLNKDCKVKGSKEICKQLMIEEVSKGNNKDDGNKISNDPTNKAVNTSKSPNISAKLKGGDTKLEEAIEKNMKIEEDKGGTEGK